MCDNAKETLTSHGKNGTILTQYLTYHSTYTARYGEKTAVLCQVGDFFELYAVINDREERGPNIYRIADMLGIQVTRRNKSNIEVNDANYLMSGFPLGGIQKHIQTLVSNCYTVVVVRQVTPPPNVRREVTEVISPSMTLSPSSQEANYMIVLVFSYTAKKWSCGIAAADVSTGSSLIREVASTLEDPEYVFDEIVRFLHTYPSKEIVILGKGLTEGCKQHILDAIGMSKRTIGIHLLWDQYPDCFHTRDYQDAILSKAGIGRGVLPAHQMIGIPEMVLGMIAITYMIQFAYEHNPKLISRLQQPKYITDSNRLVLQYNSSQQLNILGMGIQNETPLLSLLNSTVTAFGSRLFRERLLNPITNPSILKNRYEEIEYYKKEDLYEQVRKRLSGILDLERIVRKMTAELFHPTDWSSFHISLLAGRSTAELLTREELLTKIDTVLNGYQSLLDLEETSKYMLNDIRGNIFRRGIYRDLDNMTDHIKENLQYLTDVARELTQGEDARMCKVDCNDRDGYFLTSTKKRWNTITESYETKKNENTNKTINPQDFQVKPISSGSNTLRIVSDGIEKASNHILKSQANIASITQERYIEFLRAFVYQYSDTILFIAYELADIDVHTTNAMNAKEFAYHCPILADDSIPSSAKSFLEIEQLRHPIIERIQQKIDYVANDVSLNDQKNGLLLYGVNASGKSSLMKAIGLAVIMAQSGMYVPCKKMLFQPYTNIFTRISGNDNIYQGLSSFAVEMTELKNILVRADDRCLVLGDELCSGTEAISAVSIVASGIDMLMKKGALFVFATHLHELMDIPEIAEYAKQNHLQVSHMHTEIKDGKIVYDRTLRNGCGENTYGIEVCRGLGMPSEFMILAERIRRYVTNQSEGFVDQKQSRYNRQVRMDMCGVCGIQRATETHHIRYQETADKNGFIKDTHIHKNVASNLVPLCELCHQKEHRGAIHINGWKQTSDGIELDYENTDSTKSLTTEHDTENIQNAKDTKNTKNIQELANIWRPYLRYTRNGWMIRKKNTLRTKFKITPFEKLIETMRTITNIPTYLIPDSSDLDQLQTILMDVSL